MYATPYYQPYWIDDEELEHFGVKGMKWGVRRYQNPDGTLTEAGKKRYGSPENFDRAREKSKARQQKALKAAKVGALVIGSVALASVGGVKLDAAFNSGKGLAAIKKGSAVLSYGLQHEGQRAISSISKLLNVQDGPSRHIDLGQKGKNERSMLDRLLNIQDSPTQRIDLSQKNRYENTDKLSRALNIQSTPTKRTDLGRKSQSGDSGLGKLLNVKDTGWSQAPQSWKDQQLTKELRQTWAEYERIKRMQQRGSPFIG